MKPAIRIQNLSKRYRISPTELRDVQSTLREDLMRLAAMPFDRLRKGFQPAGSEEFWALKDVSFDVEPGKVMGIVGRNGAGKSTLMKIVSRITRPTSGSVHFRGRVGSLLEVSTGFHPELTGRENVFLSGAMLGMGPCEVRRKFDEIVDFSEVEKFIDTPVKRYSSGMKVRLGFAVAAHLEPEILLLDEVLSVGDVAFKKKCLEKIKSFTKTGRTTLIVSHRLGALEELCDSLTLLHHGELVGVGDTQEVLAQFHEIMNAETSAPQIPLEPSAAEILDLRLLDGQGQECHDIEVQGKFTAEITYLLREPVTKSHIVCTISEEKRGDLLVTSDVEENPDFLQGRSPGQYKVCVQLPGDLFNAGKYTVKASVESETEVGVLASHSQAIHVASSDKKNGSSLLLRKGILNHSANWRYEESTQAYPHEVGSEGVCRGPEDFGGNHRSAPAA